MLKTSVVHGFRVVSYEMPNVETVSLGIWSSIGSRHETPTQPGISHFLEHMVFKGTKGRSSVEIAKSIENVGGYLNAYTTREMTAYYAKVIKKDVALAFDILSDMLLNPAFATDELEKERNVIIQEIAQTYDNPSDVIFDYYQKSCFPDQQLGSPVLGSVESVSSISSDDLFRHISRYYASPNNLVFSAAGNIKHANLEALVSKYFSSVQRPEDDIAVTMAEYVGGSFEEKRGLEQAHLIVGFEGEPCSSPHYYSMLAYSNILGGGMSSKLFQHIREDNGLAYSIYSFPSFYRDSGTLGIYAGTKRETRDRVPDMIFAEMCAFTVSEEELQKAKNQLSASVLMELESTSSLADSMACDIIRRGTPRETAKVLAEIDQITTDSVMHIAKKIITSKMTKVLIW